jgi:hypothetical protein
MTSCDGKFSTWFVRETHNKGKILSNTCLLTSTVIPLEHTNVGSYSVGIRNSEKGTAVSLYNNVFFHWGYIYSGFGFCRFHCVTNGSNFNFELCKKDL